MINYEKINQIIEEKLTNKKLSIIIEHMDEITKLANIIIEKTPDDFIRRYGNTYVSINDSIDYVNAFFYSINPEYSYRFQNILQERIKYDSEEIPTVLFHDIYNYDYTLKQTGKTNFYNSKINHLGILNINYNESTQDIFVIAHEITHKFCFAKNERSKIKMFLSELSPITMEFLLEDYLKENSTFNIKEIATIKNNRFKSARNAAYDFIYKNIIIKLYLQNNNHISEEIIDNYFNQMDKNSKLYENFRNNIAKYLKEIADKEKLSIFESPKSIIGILMATYIYEQIQNDQNKINEFLALINLLGDSNYETKQDLETIKKLKILPFFNQDKISINDEVLQKLSDSYEQELNKVCDIYNSDKYSR